MIQCPKCKRLTLPEARVCPNCGERLPPQPELTGDALQKVANRPPPLKGGKDYFQATLGFLVAAVSPFVFCIGYLVAIAVYFGTPRRDSPFLRGFGVGLIFAAIVLLGAFALCFFGGH